ncbi:MAG: hypothetical protein GYB68_19000, partial [Chloroflexi bacterium]|nr:hypothetical protein [Chloroflexota bacterium]
MWRYNVPAKERILVVGSSLETVVKPAVQVGIAAAWINRDAAAELAATPVDNSQIPPSKSEGIVEEEKGEAGTLTRYAYLTAFKGWLAETYTSSPQQESSSKTHVFGVFEGGGAKGLGHVGAYSACHKQGIRFLGVSGTSAGSIVAGLIAAGYEPEELFSGDGKGVLESVEYTRLLGPRRWEFLQWARGKRMIGKCLLFNRKISTIRLSFFLWLVAMTFMFFSPFFLVLILLHAIFWGQGYFKTKAFREWYNELLRQKVTPTGKNNEVTFDDIEKDWHERLKLGLAGDQNLLDLLNANGCPLKIVSTNVTSRRIVLHPDDGSNALPVADAVAASISIPLVFRPMRLPDFRNGGDSAPDGECEHVDGGALSNFPAWCFKNRKDRFCAPVPVVGFHLEDSSEKAKPRAGLLPFVGQLASTVIAGSSRLSVRGIPDLHEIDLRIKTGVLDFDIGGAEKKQTFSEGKSCTLTYILKGELGYQLASQEQMAPHLRALHEGMIGVLGSVKPQLRDPQPHLRVNVVCRRVQNRKATGALHVRYTWNMMY